MQTAPVDPSDTAGTEEQKVTDPRRSESKPATEYSSAVIIEVGCQTCGEDYSHVCSGILVAPKVVLTTGVCAFDTGSKFIITAPYAPGGKRVVKVNDKAFSITYRDQFSTNVGLIKLPEAIELKAYPTIATTNASSYNDVVQLGTAINSRTDILAFSPLGLVDITWNPYLASRNLMSSGLDFRNSNPRLGGPVLNVVSLNREVVAVASGHYDFLTNDPSGRTGTYAKVFPASGAINDVINAQGRGPDSIDCLFNWAEDNMDQLRPKRPQTLHGAGYTYRQYDGNLFIGIEDVPSTNGQRHAYMLNANTNVKTDYGLAVDAIRGTGCQ